MDNFPTCPHCGYEHKNSKDTDWNYNSGMYDQSKVEENVKVKCNECTAPFYVRLYDTIAYKSADMEEDL